MIEQRRAMTTMSAYWLRGLTIAAVVVNGLLAGGNLDRTLVATPAWREIGPGAWADFSRHADLGRGQVVYPLLALGGTALVIAAAVLFLLAGRVPSSATWPILLAAIAMLIALPLSLLATPYMQSIRTINDNNNDALAHAFSGFAFWGFTQGVAHLIAFSAGVRAILALNDHAA